MPGLWGTTRCGVVYDHDSPIYRHLLVYSPKHCYFSMIFTIIVAIILNTDLTVSSHTTSHDAHNAYAAPRPERVPKHLPLG